MFYKATVQAVLLFGAEKCNVLTVTLTRLEGFHIRAAYRMVRRHESEQTPDGWVYPSSTDVLEKAGLYTIKHYIQVRCNSIVSYIMHQPIFNACREKGRKRGSRPRQFWWDQPMELDGASDAADVKPDFGGDETALL